MRKGEMYPLNLNPIRGKPVVCMLTKANSNESWLWHQILLHLNFKDINKLVLGYHMCGLLVLKFDKEHLCATCEMGKQSQKIHPSRINTKIIKPLELLHIDLCGPSTIESIGGSKLILVIVEDFSRLTCVFFLKQKYEATLNTRVSSLGIYIELIV